MQAGDSVLIRMPSTNCKVVKLTSNTTIDLGKFGSFASSELLGLPFNGHYEIHAKNQVRKYEPKDAGIDMDVDNDNDNRELVDAGAQAQKLSHLEIEALKEQSLRGEVGHESVIKQITENSDTFEGKTGFAKVKFLKRKER
ncbi:tRNA (adenine(58)-N(1))-methyltransferase non-catalytic subunit trm6, partial [Irineochytrium annulatum]